MSKILVTGGAGFVGSICCSRLLLEGHEVVVIDDLSTGHARAVPEGAELWPIDIGDREALAELLSAHKFDAAFHFAAKALIPESVTNPGVFFDRNVASGIALLEALRAELGRILQNSSHWDGQQGDLHVEDAISPTVKLIAVVTAVDGDAIEPLRREVREGLLTFLQRNYPEALPGGQARRAPA